MVQSTKKEVRIGHQGRLVIPASLRKTVGLKVGDVLLVRAEDGLLILEKREHILARIKARFAKVPRDVSLVKELVEERRSESARESKG